MAIKCTYKDCPEEFSTWKEMISHKKRDVDHSYCDLCDVDCEDDLIFFIHQLGSPLHSELLIIPMSHCFLLIVHSLLSRLWQGFQKLWRSRRTPTTGHLSSHLLPSKANPLPVPSSKSETGMCWLPSKIHLSSVINVSY